MAIKDLVYRTKTYLAGDWTGDKDLIDKLHEWNNNDNLALSFVDVHELTQSSDNSNICSIKKSLRLRLNISKTFVLVVGDHTNTITSGACFLCPYYKKWITMSPICSKGYPVDNRSYIQYECEMAAKDYNAGLLKNIVVLYNGLKAPDRSKCPEAVRWIGTHIGSDSMNLNGQLCWNYQAIKNAICK